MTEFASHYTETKPAVWSSGKTLLSVRAGADPKRGCGGCIPKHVFDEYNFSLISNLFNITISLTPKARIIENVQTKCIIFGETRRFRGKKFKQNLRINCSRSTKMATAVSKF